MRPSGERAVATSSGMAAILAMVLGLLKAGDEVVVYSEKAMTASSRIKVVDQLTGSKP